MFTRSRQAFTVVELLVVIAIIGVLVALTVPAIQMAREAARRSVCMNNIGQLAKGIQLYASQKDELPHSRDVYTISRSTGATGQVFGWVYPILPEVEQQGLYDTIRDLGIPAGDLELEVLLCPSQPDSQNPRPISYVVNGGRANYTGGSRRNEDFFPNGALVDWALGDTHVVNNPNGNTGKQTRRWDDCVDGTTNTLLIAENLNLYDWLIPYASTLPATPAEQEQYSQFLWFPDPTTAIPPNRHANPTLRPQDVLDADFNADIRYARPASFHSGGFMVAFWDGQARFLGDSIDYSVYARLMSSEGRKTQDPADTAAIPTRPSPAWQIDPLSADDY